MATQVVVQRTVTADGTLQLAGPVGLPPGPVEVTVTAAAVPAGAPATGWWQVLQEIRADREARGYPFMTEAEVTAHIDELRADDAIVQGCDRFLTNDTRLNACTAIPIDVLP